MSVSTPQLDVVRLLAAKIETTTGTEISLTGTDAAFITYNLKIVPDDPVNERQLPAALGQNASTPGLATGTCTFEVDLAGNGTTGDPAWASTFLPACDMAGTAGVYCFSRNGTTLTLGAYEDGSKRILYGARGTFKISAEDGKPARVQFEFKGIFKEDADTSMLAPTFPTVVPPVFKGATVTIGGYTPIISKLEIDAANELQMRESATAAGGLLSAVIVNRKPTFSMDPEATVTSTRDWRSIRDAGTEEALSIVIGSVANNIVTITADKAQTTKVPKDVRNGIIVRNVQGQLNGYDGTGVAATPFTIAFT